MFQTLVTVGTNICYKVLWPQGWGHPHKARYSEQHAGTAASPPSLSLPTNEISAEYLPMWMFIHR